MTKSNVNRMEALQLLIEATSRTATSFTKVIEAQGLVAAEDVHSPLNLPESPRSAMDGYAVIAADTVGAAERTRIHLECIGEIRPSGGNISSLNPGQACRILTGGILPPPADAVIPFEHVQSENGKIIISAEVKKNFSTRLIGSDININSKIIGKGEQLSPSHCSLISYAGIKEILSYDTPSVLVIAVGNELCDPLGKNVSGKIPADNLVLLKTMCVAQGFHKVTVKVCANEKEAIMEMIRNGMGHDLIITTGGTGPGQRDIVMQAACSAGCQPLFKGIRIHPAKSVFACVKDKTVVIGLPGPPNAVQLSFHFLIKPLLAYMKGLTAFNYEFKARLLKAVKRSAETERLWLCSLNTSDGTFRVMPLDDRSISVRQTMCCAHGIIALSPGISPAEENEEVTFIPFLMPNLV